MLRSSPDGHRVQVDASRSYDVLVVPGMLDPADRTLAASLGSGRALLVTDPTVDALHGRALRAYLAGVEADVAVHVRPLTEPDKAMPAVLDVCEAAAAHGIGRRDLLVSFGGGVCSDVVSLAASLVRRGVPHLRLPTTLVGQVDAGIGLKGGVNLGGRKNYLGCFTPPHRVLLDPLLLRTLPPREVRAGLAEVVKMALVCDGALFDRLVAAGPALVASGFAAPPGEGEAVVRRAVALMLAQLSGNWYEDRGLERLVDFGHTFSPRLEELSGYALRHGEAVALDMALSSAVAAELGLLPPDELDRVLSGLQALGLAVHSPLMTVDVLQEGMRSACLHRDGALNLVVPVAVGRATFLREPGAVPAELLERALARTAAGQRVLQPAR